jgi:hypothetical protein
MDTLTRTAAGRGPRPSIRHRDARLVGYETPAFEAASELALELLARRRRPLRLAVHVLAHAPQTLAAARTIRRLGRVELWVTADPPGRELERAVAQRWWGLPTGTWAWGVLALSENIDAYLAGRSRRRLRRGLDDARKLNISCGPVDDPSTQRANLDAIFKQREWSDDALETFALEGVMPGKDHHFAAREQSGRVLAVAVVTVDARVAWLRMMLAVPDRNLSSAARYALSAAVVEALLERGCEHLVVADALTMSPGLHYFQARLGFGPRNVVLRSI